MEVFTMCDCNNLTNSYAVHNEQSANPSSKQEKSHSVNETLVFGFSFLPQYFEVVVGTFECNLPFCEPTQASHSFLEVVGTP